jgi:hypothetical protein
MLPVAVVHVGCVVVAVATAGAGVTASCTALLIKRQAEDVISQ